MFELLVVFSALSGLEGALAEAVYEEIDYLVTPKEDLLGSPGVCLCLALLGPLVVSLGFSASTDPTSAPGSQRQPLQQRWHDGPLQSPCELLTPFTLQEPRLSQHVLSASWLLWEWEGLFCSFVMIFFTLGFLSDDSVTKLPYYTGEGEENRDSKSAPDGRGGCAWAGCWGQGSSPLWMGPKGSGSPLTGIVGPLDSRWGPDSHSLTVL